MLMFMSVHVYVHENITYFVYVIQVCVHENVTYFVNGQLYDYIHVHLHVYVHVNIYIPYM